MDRPAERYCNFALVPANTKYFTARAVNNHPCIHFRCTLQEKTDRIQTAQDKGNDGEKIILSPEHNANRQPEATVKNVIQPFYARNNVHQLKGGKHNAYKKAQNSNEKNYLSKLGQFFPVQNKPP